jgi:hypothetical protein
MKIKKQNINYFKSYTAVFDKLDSDERIRTKHIALFVPIYARWNKLLFPKTFLISRTEFMRKSHLKCKKTYAQVLKDLDKFGYINYNRTFSNRSQVELFNYEFGSCGLPRIGGVKPTCGVVDETGKDANQTSVSKNQSGLGVQKQHIEEQVPFKEESDKECRGKNNKTSTYSKESYHNAFNSFEINASEAEGNESLKATFL